MRLIASLLSFILSSLCLFPQDAINLIPSLRSSLMPFVLIIRSSLLILRLSSLLTRPKA